MNRPAENHFDGEDILNLFIRPEAERSKQELLFNINEIQFYRYLLVQKMLQKSSLNTGRPKFLLHQLQLFRETNDALSQALLEFQKEMESTKVCGNVEDKYIYMKNLITLKESLDDHSRDFRTIKKVVFKYLYNHNVLRIQRK